MRAAQGPREGRTAEGFLLDHATQDRLFGGLGLERRRGAAIAVSGGSDSLALLHLLKAWRDRRAPSLSLLAVTVDHGLRAESAAEAARVASICAAWGVPHSTMVWSGDKPTSGLPEAARLVRYGMLAEAGTMVLTGHTMDDQAETVAMRGRRGGGGGDLRGMAGMARATLHEDRAWIVRPLLSMRRKALRDMLNQAGIAWIDDPTNESPASERVRVRRALAAEPDAVERLAAQAADAATARMNANAAAARIMTRGERAAPGLVRLNGDQVLNGGDAGVLCLRVLAAAMGGSAHLPDARAARRLIERLAAGASSGTLAGSVVAAAGGGLWFHREGRNLPGPGRAPAGTVWDGRFRTQADVELEPTGTARARAAAGAYEKAPRRLVTGAICAEPHAGACGPALRRLVPPWVTFLPGFDVALRNAVARLVGADQVADDPAATTAQ